MKKFIVRYKHASIAIVYLTIYLLWFFYLEQTVKRPSNLIHMKVDDSIPFCEAFVVPYILWFVYVSLTVIYLVFTNKREYYRCCAFLFTGMTVFLVVSTLWPNGHHLRPYIMPRDNIFTDMVKALYLSDTPTNLWPSIHVYNSIGAHIAIAKNRTLGKNKAIHISSLLLCISIILSTVFIKQHSVFDVITAFIMAAVMYLIVYSFDIVTVCQMYRYIHHKRRRIRHV